MGGWLSLYSRRVLAGDSPDLGESPLGLNSSSQAQVKIAFGSCLQQNKPQPIWDSVLNQSPDAFVFLGDNIYADTEDMELMKACYDLQKANPDYSRFRSRVPIFATWDDHDFGVNDGGREYPRKEESKRLMLDFFDEPLSSPRRNREGVYDSYFIEKNGLRVQLILLDLRWFRSPLLKGAIRSYLPNHDPQATLLGIEQWKWLKAQLKKPADIRLLGSSIQFASTEPEWERWSCFPLERERLLNLIDHLRVDNLVILSGDMHFGEISLDKTPKGREILDITSSGLNRFESSEGLPNQKRLGVFDTGENFGFITVFKTQGGRVDLRLEVRDVAGRSQIGVHKFL